MYQGFLPSAHSGNQTQNLGIKQTSVWSILLKEPYYSASHNASAYSPNSCEWPPKVLGAF